MSDSETNEVTTKAADKKPLFTEKEEAVLKVAWRCLKSGPPEIDMEKLTKLGSFNTQKTASNTWGVIKKKLFADADNNAMASAPGTLAAAKTPKTPKTKKAPATPASKKRTKKAEDDGDDDEEEGRSLVKKTKRVIKREDSDEE